MDLGSRRLSGACPPAATSANGNGFFDAFGHGSTNQHAQDLKVDTKNFDTKVEAAGSYDDNAMVTSPTMAGWQTEMNPQFPPSPPGSATLPPKNRPLSGLSGYPPGLFTNSQNYSSILSEYGQITPPDDETESVLDSELRQYQGHQSNEFPPSYPTSTVPGSNDQPSSISHQELSPPPKRTRKYTPRKPKRSPPDSGKQGDARRSKFLERNRVAASKCRQKKKEWTQKLEGRARDLQTENGNLRLCVESLSDEIFYIKNQMTEHKDCNCTAIQEFITGQAKPSKSPKGLFAHQGFDGMGHSRARTTSTAPSTSATDASPTREDETDESALEALLSSSINHDTSDEGIARRIEG